MGLTIQPSLRSTGEAPGTGIAASHCPAPPYSPARAWDTPARPSAVRTNAPALDPTELHPSQPRRRQRRVLAPATGNTGAWPAGGRCYTTSPVPQAVGGDKQLPSSAASPGSEARQTLAGRGLPDRLRGKATCEATQCPRSRPDHCETGRKHSRAFVVLDERPFPTMRLLAFWAPPPGRSGPPSCRLAHG